MRVLNAGTLDPDDELAQVAEAFDPDGSWDKAYGPTLQGQGWRRHFKVPSAARPWIDNDWGVADAIRWDQAGFDAATATAWRDAKVGAPHQVAKLTEDGFTTPQSLHPWVAAGVDNALDVLRWAKADPDPGIACQVTAAWIAAGITRPFDALQWRDAGFEPTVAADWLDSGAHPNVHSPRQALDLIAAGVPDKATYMRWREAGTSSPEDTIRWVSVSAPADHITVWAEMGISEPIDQMRFWRRVGVKDGTDAVEMGVPNERKVRETINQREFYFRAWEDSNRPGVLEAGWFPSTANDEDAIDRWFDEGIRKSDIAHWERLGIPVEWVAAAHSAHVYTMNGVREVMTMWRDAGWDDGDAQGWLHNCGNAISPASATRWRDDGVSPHTVRLWHDAGLDGQFARAWMDAGFKHPGAIKPWVAAKASPATAGRWRAQYPQVMVDDDAWDAEGVSRKERLWWCALGVSPEWRRGWVSAGYPTAKSAYKGVNMWGGVLPGGVPDPPTPDMSADAGGVEDRGGHADLAPRRP